jgi:integrase
LSRQLPGQGRLAPTVTAIPHQRKIRGFSIQIADTIFAFTGIHMHVHMFRHTGALLYLQRNPGGYEVLKRVMGHRSMDTTASIYCGLEMLSSAKHFDEEILAHDDTPRGRNQRTPAAEKRAKRRSAA